MRKHLICAVVCLLACSARGQAEQIRYRFVPTDPNSSRVSQVPASPEGAIGEKITGLGLIPKPYRENVRPTHMVTFRHPFTARYVSVPMALPAGTARIVTRSDRITYNYSGRWIDVRFLKDGSVETIYSSGLLRAR